MQGPTSCSPARGQVSDVVFGVYALDMLVARPIAKFVQRISDRRAKPRAYGPTRAETMIADEIRAAVMAAPRAKLPDVAVVMWSAYSGGTLTEAEAEALSALIEARKALLAAAAQGAAEERAAADRTRASQDAARRGSAPLSPDSLERRRRWATSGWLPPALAARHTLGEHAVLAVVAREVRARGDCRLPIGRIAAEAGVCETTARRAIREARLAGLLTVEERRLTAWRSDTNVLRIVSAEWLSWLRLARSSAPRGGGCRFVEPTSTHRLYKSDQRPAAPSQRLPRGRAASPAALESRSAEGR